MLCVSRGYCSLKTIVSGGIFLVLIVAYICYTCHLKRNKLEADFDQSEQFSSSVWCQTDGDNIKRCSFQNLCYSSELKFLFVLSNRSILSGLGDRDGFKRIKGSSVFGHNGFYLPISPISVESQLLKSVEFVNHPVFLLWRFKPDNIMHVIHDDVLPLYLTYNEICCGDIDTCISLYSLVFVDDHETESFSEWYKILSNLEPVSLSQLSNGGTICFRHSRTGVSTKGVFFQYGFNQSQGPKESDMNGTQLKQFANFVLSKFNIKPVPAIPLYTLISRQINRKILNEDFVEQQIRNILNQKYSINISIKKIDASCNSSHELLLTVSSSKLLLGMHGSGMMLAIFMPFGSSVVELFPYGVSYNYVSPLNAISHFSGIHFTYWHWTNKIEINSIPHPEYHPLFGGIHDLPKETQTEVVNTKSVLPTKCCHNPVYLYRMYQDTIVDDSLIPVLEKAIDKIYPFVYTDYLNLWETWFFPAPVSNVTCSTLKSCVKISWYKPHNADAYKVKYKLVISKKGQHFLYYTYSTSIHLNDSISLNEKLEVWISASANNYESIETYIVC